MYIMYIVLKYIWRSVQIHNWLSRHAQKSKGIQRTQTVHTAIRLQSIHDSNTILLEVCLMGWWIQRLLYITGSSTKKDIFEQTFTSCIGSEFSLAKWVYLVALCRWHCLLNRSGTCHMSHVSEALQNKPEPHSSLHSGMLLWIQTKQRNWSWQPVPKLTYWRYLKSQEREQKQVQV